MVAHRTDLVPSKVVLEKVGSSYETRMAVSNTKTGWLVIERRHVGRCRDLGKLREKALAIARANKVKFEDRTREE